ncbi:MAG TPA: hypothetical protein VHL57_05495 [Flavobacteriales bacterium]|nr:hypothetical protein [Flavobacteriales bacterium]
MPKAEVDVKLGDERAEQPESERSPEVKSFQRQGGAPVIPHPARASAEGATHDRPGSQPERMKHLYPNGNRPNAGSARSTQAKGKRRDNMTQGGE